MFRFNIRVRPDLGPTRGPRRGPHLVGRSCKKETKQRPVNHGRQLDFQGKTILHTEELLSRRTDPINGHRLGNGSLVIRAGVGGNYKSCSIPLFLGVFGKFTGSIL